MNLFHFAAAALGAAGRAADKTHHTSGRLGEPSGESCTPCAASAYAEASAREARELLGLKKNKKKR